MPDPVDEAGNLRAQVESLSREVVRLQERVRAVEEARGTPSPSARPHFERHFGLTAVNRIGAFTVAVGMIFFFRYAVDNEWIGAAGRVAAGIACGLFLMGAAEWLNGRGQRTFSQGITGCGLATLYISLYAAFGYYKLMPAAEALGALAAICSVAVAFSFRYRNAAIAGLGFLGGLLTPILLRPVPTTGWTDLLYLLLLDMTCIAISMRQGWAVLIPWIGASAVLSGWFLIDSHDPGNFALFAFALAVLHTAGAGMRSGARGVRNALYLTGCGCFIMGVLRELEMWVSGNVAQVNRDSVVSELDSLFLGVCGIAALGYGMARGSAINRSLGLSLLGLVIVKLYAWDVWFLERFYRTTAFVSLGVLLLAGSWIYSRSRSSTG